MQELRKIGDQPAKTAWRDTRPWQGGQPGGTAAVMAGQESAASNADPRVHGHPHFPDAMNAMRLRRSVVVILLLVAAQGGGLQADDESAVQPVAFLKAPEFDEPSPQPTPDDDNFVFRLVHRLIPDDETGPPPPADIASPGPDTANFPNSPFTLPKGRSYIESVPGTFSLAGRDGTPATWSWPFMMRTGITDDCELRLISQGPTVVAATATQPSTSGFAPLVFDLKIHLWGEKDWLYWPIVGVETFVLTGAASRPFEVGTEPGVELLFDHRLPGDWLIEWNVGCYGAGAAGLPDELSLPTLGAQWAVQKQFTPRFAGFVHGFYNAAGLPYFPSNLVVGLGVQWNATERLAVYTNYNWSVDGMESPSGGFSGFAYAY